MIWGIKLKNLVVNNMPKFSIKDRIKSFGYAFNGIVTLLKNEHNAWIHVFAVLLTTSAGFYFKITSIEWIILILCFGLVLAAEAFNSSIEALANKVEPNKDPLIKNTKDLAAGAVLILSIASLIIGLIIFIPYFS